MPCCNLCFEVQLGVVPSRQAQGHYLCSPVTEGALVAFIAGHRPTFYTNYWSGPTEAIKSYVLPDGEQVWFDGSRYFTVDWEEACIKLDNLPSEPAMNKESE